MAKKKQAEQVRGFRSRIVGSGTKPASQFTANPRNPRTHPQNQRDAVKGSLTELGFIQTVIENVRSGYVIDGHERIWQALQNGDSDVPFVQVDLSPEEEALALATFDPIGAMAGVDKENLDALLREIQTGDASLQTLLDDLAKDAGLYQTPEVNEDAVPEPPKVPVTKPGDLWILGEHRLLCGDSTKAEDVGRVMGGEKADIAITDPPYGIRLQNHDRGGARSDKDWTIENDESTAVGQTVIDSLRADEIAVVAFASPDLPWNGKWRSRLVWWKDGGGMGGDPKLCWRRDWELILVAGNAPLSGGRDSAILRFPHPPTEFKDHPTTKPVALLGYLINKTTAGGARIFDPFLGSGTTLIAAEQLSRRCFGVEITPEYCDVIIERWERLTGGKATRG